MLTHPGHMRRATRQQRQLWRTVGRRSTAAVGPSTGRHTTGGPAHRRCAAWPGWAGRCAPSGWPSVLCQLSLHVQCQHVRCDSQERTSCLTSTRSGGRPALRARVATGAAKRPFCCGSVTPLTRRTTARAYRLRSPASDRGLYGGTHGPKAVSWRLASTSRAVQSTAKGSFPPRPRHVATRCSAATHASPRSQSRPLATALHSAQQENGTRRPELAILADAEWLSSPGAVRTSSLTWRGGATLMRRHRATRAAQVPAWRAPASLLPPRKHGRTCHDGAGAG